MSVIAVSLQSPITAFHTLRVQREHKAAERDRVTKAEFQWYAYPRQLRDLRSVL